MLRADWRPLLERTCALAVDFLHGLPDRPVAARQGPADMLAAFDRPVPQSPGDPAEVIERVTVEGECLPSSTVWRGAAAMRISVCSWATDDDVRRTVTAIARAHAG